MFGHWEIILVFLVVVLLFGAKRIPELAAGIGNGIRTFKKSLNEDPDQHKNENVKRIEETSKPS